MDQSFLDFEDDSFDLVWARHVIEHSFMPLYTLTEFKRVLRPGAILYMEVPAPDTLLHEQNPNHYSVLGKVMWTSLLERVGFTIAGTVDFFLDTPSGRTDSYWGYFALASNSNAPTGFSGGRS
jgi:ubiquinone/menaquinone biosynthesis C-methylase UbiE